MIKRLAIACLLLTFTALAAVAQTKTHWSFNAETFPERFADRFRAKMQTFSQWGYYPNHDQYALGPVLDTELWLPINLHVAEMDEQRRIICTRQEGQPFKSTTLELHAGWQPSALLWGNASRYCRLNATYRMFVDLELLNWDEWYAAATPKSWHNVFQCSGITDRGDRGGAGTVCIYLDPHSGQDPDEHGTPGPARWRLKVRGASAPIHESYETDLSYYFPLEGNRLVAEIIVRFGYNNTGRITARFNGFLLANESGINTAYNSRAHGNWSDPETGIDQTAGPIRFGNYAPVAPTGGVPASIAFNRVELEILDY